MPLTIKTEKRVLLLIIVVGVFIAGVFLAAGHVYMFFFSIAVFYLHLAFLFRIAQMGDQSIVVRYPLRLIWRLDSIPYSDIVSLRLVRGSYTAGFVILLEYRNGLKLKKLSLPYNNFEEWEGIVGVCRQNKPSVSIKNEI